MIILLQIGQQIALLYKLKNLKYIAQLKILLWCVVFAGL